MRNHENLVFPNSCKLGNVFLKVTYVFQTFSKNVVFVILRRPAVTLGTHCTRALAAEDVEGIKDMIEDIDDVKICEIMKILISQILTKFGNVFLKILYVCRVFSKNVVFVHFSCFSQIRRDLGTHCTNAVPVYPPEAFGFLDTR